MRRSDRPWLLDGPIHRATFECYIETQLAPSLKPGDVVILDNLAGHKSPKASQCLKDKGAWFLVDVNASPEYQAHLMTVMGRRAVAATTV